MVGRSDCEEGEGRGEGRMVGREGEEYNNNSTHYEISWKAEGGSQLDQVLASVLYSQYSDRFPVM